MITASDIIALAPAAEAYAPQLLDQMKRSQIDVRPQRAAMFLGQIHVESGGFKNVVENLNYSTGALISLFGRHRISAAEAQRYGRNEQHPADPQALANVLYGGAFGRRELGNTEVGDGWRFRGSGLKQLTGRDNYRRFSLAWLGDESLLRDPVRIERPDGAVASAIWFWNSHRLNELADYGDVVAVTKTVNGGSNGLDERRRWYNAYLKAFQT